MASVKRRTRTRRSSIRIPTLQKTPATERDACRQTLSVAVARRAARNSRPRTADVSRVPWIGCGSNPRVYPALACSPRRWHPPRALALLMGSRVAQLPTVPSRDGMPSADVCARARVPPSPRAGIPQVVHNVATIPDRFERVNVDCGPISQFRNKRCRTAIPHAAALKQIQACRHRTSTMRNGPELPPGRFNSCADEPAQPPVMCGSGSTGCEPLRSSKWSCG
jgi:hypothetical protein